MKSMQGRLATIAGTSLLCMAASAQTASFSVGPSVAASPVSDSPNSLFIDRDGSFYAQNALSQYDDNPDNHYWKFYSGADVDNLSEARAHSQYDTRVLCNDRNPVAIALFGQPVTSRTGYTQADYCDLVGVWVDPDSGNWYGVVHNELFGNDPRVDAISYAISTDQGANWTLQDPILTSPYGRGDPKTPYYYYGDGDPRLYVDNVGGYFYIFYTSRIQGQNGNPGGFDNYMWAHAARAPIKDKMKPASWQKFYAGKWQQVPGTNWTCDAATAAATPCATAPVSSSLESNIAGPTSDLGAQGGPAADGTGSERFVPPAQGAGDLLSAGYTNGTMRVMNVAWNLYLQKYVAVAEDRAITKPGTRDFDYNGPASTLKFYVSDDLATQQWRFAGSVPYQTASWYRWFTDSVSKTASDTLGNRFRTYCVYGKCQTYGAEYADVTITPDASRDAASLAYADAGGMRLAVKSAPVQAYVVHPGNGGTNLPAAASGAWTLGALGDGFFTLQLGGRYLGVGSGNAGRAWGAAPVWSSSAGGVQQQWYFQKIGSGGSGGYRIVNRYSGLALNVSGTALTSDLAGVTTVPIRSWDAAAGASIPVWPQAGQALRLVAR
ncbi:RICIN domain-containing protein [Burkholderia gladioli]|uniref:RICIN domain-containing protein n=1 Tax=Burkholderia gladioli TaxID=28095 RepID=UPI0016402DC5|nr:RICIN domain-containing protein [Burkholderia gladioli]